MDIIKSNTRLIYKDVSRINFLMGFIGTNRTGKTTVAERIAQNWKEKRPDDTIVGHDPQRKFDHLLDYKIQPGNKYWAKDCQELRNALIILDDYKMINPQNTPVEGLSDLLYLRAEYNIDIIYICHNPALILNIFTYLTTHYFLFFTQSTDGSFQKKIPNYQLCMNASRVVNQYVKVNGRGKYPNFPFITVETDSEKISAFNMDGNHKGLVNNMIG